MFYIKCFHLKIHSSHMRPYTAHGLFNKWTTTKIFHIWPWDEVRWQLRTLHDNSFTALQYSYTKTTEMGRTCRANGPWSRILLEKLTVAHLLKICWAFNGNLRFVTAFTRARHWSLFYYIWTQLKPYVKSILILSSNLCLAYSLHVSQPKCCIGFSTLSCLLHARSITQSIITNKNKVHGVESSLMQIRGSLPVTGPYTEPNASRPYNIIQHLHLHISSVSSLQVLLTKILHALLISPMHATRPAHLILFHLPTPTISEVYKL